MKQTEDVIYSVLTRVIQEEGLEARVHDKARLVDDLGLQSLHIARVVLMLELELELEVDPFDTGQVPITGIQTVGDLCAVYSTHARTGQTVKRK